MIEKQVIIATIHERQESDRHVYFQYGLDGDDAREGVYITRKTWDEFGQPDIITVAIEAGHNLDPELHKEVQLTRIPSTTPRVPLNFPVTPSGG